MKKFTRDCFDQPTFSFICYFHLKFDPVLITLIVLG